LFPDFVFPVCYFQVDINFEDWKRKTPPPAEPAGAIRLDGANSPIQVYVNPLDSLSTNVILPRCESGNVTTTFPLCSDDDYYSGNASISAIYISPAINGRTSPDRVVVFYPDQYSCRPCSNQSG
jgi:hypothetical protein